MTQLKLFKSSMTAVHGRVRCTQYNTFVLYCLKHAKNESKAYSLLLYQNKIITQDNI